MTIVDPLTPVGAWRSLHHCRDIARWLEGAGPVPVHTTLMQLEDVPGEEAVLAAVTFVAMRRRLLAERRPDLARTLDLSDFRPSLTAWGHSRTDLADDCLELVGDEAAGRPLTILARRLHATHGLSPVLALASLAKALGALLVETPAGYSSYSDLYCAETALISRLPLRMQ